MTRSAQKCATRVVITGATDGIGKALAKLFKHKNAELLLIGRRPFDEIDSPEPLVTKDFLRIDLTEATCAQAIATEIESRFPDGVDLLIHNAAAGYWGPISGQPEKNIRLLLDVNLAAPIAITHRVVPDLLKRNGKIVFISSVVSSLACPDFGVYAATKAALDGFARSLRIEFEDKIQVQTIHPGATRTSMHEKAGLPREIADWTRFPPAEEAAQRIFDKIAGSAAATSTLGISIRLARLAGGKFAAPLDWVQRRRRAKR